MPHWADENGRFWYTPKGLSQWQSVEIPHAPLMVHAGCSCAFCWEHWAEQGVKPPKPPKNPMHSSKHSSWGTPVEVVDFIRTVLGRIDFDPFSSDAWNRTIHAKRYLTEKKDAFKTLWGKPNENLTAMVNPPGDPRGENVKKAWELTTRYYHDGTLGGGVIWVAFSIHQLQVLQNARVSILNHDFLRLIPRRRFDYQSSPGVSGGAPTHPSALVLLPAADGEIRDHQRDLFIDAGAAFGEVI